MCFLSDGWEVGLPGPDVLTVATWCNPRLQVLQEQQRGAHLLQGQWAYLQAAV